MTNTKPVFHGSDIEKISEYYHIDQNSITNFAGNVNPLGLSPSVKEAVAAHVDLFSSYPDRDYKSLRNTIAEYCDVPADFISADYLKMISSVQVAAAINVKLYLMLALVLFFVIGCCGAILLGRISDAVDYLLYVDKKTGLPNREKLNVYISGMADRILPEDYTCFALQLDNLTEMSRRFGYHVGDGILKDFSGLLQLMGDTDGTVGYNGAGKFLAFLDEG